MGIKASVIIPSLNRRDSLNRCLASLREQTCQDFETIVLTEEGDLAQIRNQGAKIATGEILVFIDDDVVCSPEWLSEILRSFTEGVDGCSGPAIIQAQYRQQRDLFRFGWIKQLYDILFLSPDQHLPGHFTSAGAWTTGASEEMCAYEGEVHFLEACNMAWRK